MYVLEEMQKFALEWRNLSFLKKIWVKDNCMISLRDSEFKVTPLRTGLRVRNPPNTLLRNYYSKRDCQLDISYPQ